MLHRSRGTHLLSFYNGIIILLLAWCCTHISGAACADKQSAMDKAYAAALYFGDHFIQCFLCFVLAFDYPSQRKVRLATGLSMVVGCGGAALLFDKRREACSKVTISESYQSMFDDAIICSMALSAMILKHRHRITACIAKCKPWRSVTQHDTLLPSSHLSILCEQAAVSPRAVTSSHRPFHVMWLLLMIWTLGNSGSLLVLNALDQPYCINRIFGLVIQCAFPGVAYYTVITDSNHWMEISNWLCETAQEEDGDCRIPLESIEELKMRLTYTWERTADKLGAGAEANVYLARLGTTPVAAKVWEALDDLGACAQVVRESALLNCVRHQNVVNLEGLCLEAPSQICMLLELCPHGNLHHFLSRHAMDPHPPPIPWLDCIEMLEGTAAGMAAIHAAGIVHRDLKSPNVLLGGSMKDEGVLVPKISDFGCSQLAERRYHRESQWGTEPFAAPESSGSQFTYMCDVYSFGFIVYEAFNMGVHFVQTSGGRVVGRQRYSAVEFYAFKHSNKSHSGHVVSEQCMTPLLEDGTGEDPWNRIPEWKEWAIDCPCEIQMTITELLNRCWGLDPCERPSFEQIRESLSEIRLKSTRC